MNITVNLIVDSLIASREEFGEIFHETQRDIRVTDRVLFDILTIDEKDDKVAFKKAIDNAISRGLLMKLIKAIVDSGRETGELAKEFRRDALDANPELQAIVNAGGISQVIASAMVARAERCTCKIMIRGRFSGTGVLFQPHLVLTAWHVVKNAFNDNGPEDYTPRLVEVVFDDIPGKRQTEPITVGVKDKWCVAYSRCHVMELNDQLPAKLIDLSGSYDYAVIALDKPIGLERMYIPLDRRVLVPRNDEMAFLFQYPAGNPLSNDPHVIRPLDPPDPKVIPRLRFLHSVNTTHGSSGGPFFDRTFSLFGIHQGAWKQNGVCKVNRGVPIMRIIEDVKQTIGDFPPLDSTDMKMWRFTSRNEFIPVIGCDNFQNLIWKALTCDVPRILIIEGKKGRGKTFRTKLLDDMLTSTNSMKLTLPVAAFEDKDVLDFVGFVCTTIGVSAPEISPEENYSTGSASWMRDEVAQKLFASLDERRQGRKLWIIIKNLDMNNILKPRLSQFLFILYESVKKFDWLRFVLDGMQTDIPGELTALTANDEAKDFTETDFKTYLERVITEVKSQAQADILANLLAAKYRTALAINQAEAKKGVINDVNEFTQAIMRNP